MSPASASVIYIKTHLSEGVEVRRGMCSAVFRNKHRMVIVVGPTAVFNLLPMISLWHMDGFLMILRGGFRRIR